jgi:hypothetical protein
MWGHTTLDPDFFGVPLSQLPWHFILTSALTLGVMAFITTAVNWRYGKHAARKTFIGLAAPWLFGEFYKAFIYLLISLLH